MGEVSKSTMKKKKKKGRPSLLDLQKRFLKQQKLQEQHQEPLNAFHFPSNPKNPPSCRNPNVHPATEQVPITAAAVADDDDERIEKKHKPLLGLTSRQNCPTLSGYSLRKSASYGEESETALKRRRTGAAQFGSSQVREDKALKATDTAHGSQVESGPTTTLPDKKLLIFILDRLQKKDTHGVFSEPVDPNDLPDYHVIIQNPMDFGTVRTKLDGGAYANLEQFEEDIFLICSNAMKYNASDTVFFRQARSIQELAKKDFENLRRESSDESEPEQKVVRRGRPPGKSLKKSLGLCNPIESNGAEFCSGATLASGCDDSYNVNGYSLRRARSTFRPLPADPLARTSSAAQTQHGETLASWLPEWKNEFPASVLKGVLKSGKNDNMAVNENRRDTYNRSMSCGNWPSVFGDLDGDLKQLITVGLHAEHGYARSLALFAADLGPAVWNIALKKIESISRELGRVLIHEIEMLQQHRLLPLDGGSSDMKTVAKSTAVLPCRSISGSNIGVSNNFLKLGEDAGDEIDRVRNPESETVLLDRSRGVTGSTTCIPNEQNVVVPSNIHTTNGNLFPHFLQEMRMVRLDSILGGTSYSDYSTCPSLNNASFQIPSSSDNTDLLSQAGMPKLAEEVASQSHALLHSPARVYIQDSVDAQQDKRSEKAHWQELSTRPVLDSITFNTDLNFGLGLSAAPSSNLQILSQIQPDLVLQL
ncbi:Bromodomain domain-containing protein [Cucumis melo var. makuwa]|uniref:Bromodomain domain-containing protein n=2 Tax=Cucumis melo TaxID=3656 RepID=A0A5A7VEA9_CUCMM|nr:Bromodomain domain-containing protein [Cucumis melo var. makuwa]TYK19946.1 Bromodomain domain-containing protein [Cucumis melo var. makuwa]